MEEKLIIKFEIFESKKSTRLEVDPYGEENWDDKDEFDDLYKEVLKVKGTRVEYLRDIRHLYRGYEEPGANRLLNIYLKTDYPIMQIFRMINENEIKVNLFPFDFKFHDEFYYEFPDKNLAYTLKYLIRQCKKGVMRYKRLRVDYLNESIET